MKKAAKYITNSVIIALLIILNLFTDYHFPWLYLWLFLAPAIIIDQAIVMPAKRKKKIGSIFRFSFAFLMLGFAIYELIIG
ncbi:hypothetical protein SAMN04487936_106236 [Halobacillus dabanensis]|uniref:Uncharacterized protein n=1 Tax=Halobacillus dabanensis TaxID=240302 RepID=A0A1I3WAJ4_HALDA|nr:hypothetical protein [Halobacillus dabanensis]SFK03481.1 hypothetical protein SAMN04487936_106236 [Halobacillus dabanensis]